MRPHQKIGRAKHGQHAGESQSRDQPCRLGGPFFRWRPWRCSAFRLPVFGDRRRRCIVLNRSLVSGWWRRRLIRRLLRILRLLGRILLRRPVLRGRLLAILGRRVLSWRLTLRLPVLRRSLLAILRHLTRGRVLRWLNLRRRSLGGRSLRRSGRLGWSILLWRRCAFLHWREAERTLGLRWRHIVSATGADPIKHMYPLYTTEGRKALQ